MGLVPLLPPPPLSMKLALAIPGLTPENRLDMQIAAGFNPASLPPLNFGGGPMIQMAMMFSLMAGAFALDDLPALEMQMEQAGQSIVSNVWPKLGWLTSLKMQPLLNFAIVAQLALDLQALGIDPFNIESFPSVPESMNSRFRFALPMPQIALTRLVAGLPNLLMMNDILGLPPLGESGAVSALRNRLDGFASLKPPSLAIPFPVLQKLTWVLQSLATIQAAFGPGAFQPPMFHRIQRMIALWSGLRMPFPPLEALALSAKLDSLPSMEAINMGQTVAGSMGGFSMGFTPPTLAIAPFLNIVLSLNGAFQLALDMDPFDMCSMCPCA